MVYNHTVQGTVLGAYGIGGRVQHPGKWVALEVMKATRLCGILY